MSNAEPKGGNPMKFRKKPVVIDAFQFTQEMAESKLFDGVDLPEPIIVARANFHPIERAIYSSKFVIETLEGQMEVSIGDWVIRGVKGEFYPCKPDIFEATYEQAAP